MVCTRAQGPQVVRRLRGGRACKDNSSSWHSIISLTYRWWISCNSSRSCNIRRRPQQYQKQQDFGYHNKLRGKGGAVDSPQYAAESQDFEDCGVITGDHALRVTGEVDLERSNNNKVRWIGGSVVRSHSSGLLSDAGVNGLKASHPKFNRETQKRAQNAIRIILRPPRMHVCTERSVEVGDPNLPTEYWIQQGYSRIDTKKQGLPVSFSMRVIRMKYCFSGCFRPYRAA